MATNLSDYYTKTQSEAKFLTADDATKLGGELPSSYALASTLCGCWIDFTDEEGNVTTEPYIHWTVDDGEDT